MAEETREVNSNPFGTLFLPETPKHQTYLVETGQTARLASIDAMKPPHSPLLLRIIDYVERRGRFGATRDEVATGLRRPIQSVCSPILHLLQDGELVDTRVRRQTQWGREATVFVHRSFADQSVIARLPDSKEVRA